MIKVVKFNDEVKLFFNGENFMEIKQECVDSGLKYKEEDGFRFHTGKPSAFWNAIPEFEKIEEVVYIPNKQEILKFCEPTVDIKFYRKSVNDSLLKFKPIKGKAGIHENYQYEAIQKGIQQSAVIYSLPMGSGKSYIMANIINHLDYNKDVDKFLIVLPPHLRITIRQELIKFYYNDELTNDDFYIVTTKNRDPFTSDAKFIIVSYQNLTMINDDYYFKVKKKKSKTYRKGFLPFESWGTSRCLIADEVHLAKNIKSRTAKSLHMYKHLFNYKYLFSGTLTPNNAGELYSPITLLDDNLITKDFSSWIKTIANVGNRFSDYAVNYFYDDKVKKFTNSMSKYIYTKQAEDILDLPDYINEKLYADLSDIQLQIYQELVKYTLHIIKEEKGEITTKELVNKFSYMSLALDNPSIIKGKIDKHKNPVLYSLLNKWNFKKHFNKLEILESLANQYINEENRKYIIWCYHPVTIEELKEALSQYNPLIIHGAIQHKDLAQYKEDTVELFRHSKDHNMLIVNPYMLDSGKTLIEVTRQSYVDRNHNYRVYAQSSKRIHRIGSTEPVISSDLIYANTLDERVDASLDKKSDISKNLLKKDYLTKDEMKDIILGKII